MQGRLGRSPRVLGVRPSLGREDDCSALTSYHSPVCFWEAQALAVPSLLLVGWGRWQKRPVHETIAGTRAPLQHLVGTLLVWGCPERSLLGAATAWGPCLGTQQPPPSPEDGPDVLGTVAPGSPAAPPPGTAGSSRILQPPAGLCSPGIRLRASPDLYCTGKTQYRVKPHRQPPQRSLREGSAAPREVRAMGTGRPAGLRASPSGGISCAGRRPGP